MPDEGLPEPEASNADTEVPTATPVPAAAPVPIDPTATPAPAASPVPAPATVPGPAVDPGCTAGGVPTFDSVREKIETRYGTAIGASELDADTPEGRTVEEQYDARQRAAAERLQQIRQSMRDDADRRDNT